jgi:hypothetical protein
LKRHSDVDGTRGYRLGLPNGQERISISLLILTLYYCQTHTASLFASDLKGTEEPDGAFGGGGPAHRLES